MNMNKILYNLIKSYSDDDIFEILSFITDVLKKRGYDVDVRCS